MIDHPRVVKELNETVRPAADRLASLCAFADHFCSVVTPEFLALAEITPEELTAPDIPEGYSEEPINDGADADGRPVATKLKLLAFARVVYKFKQQIDAEDAYVRRVAYSLAVNPRG